MLAGPDKSERMHRTAHARDAPPRSPELQRLCVCGGQPWYWENPLPRSDCSIRPFDWSAWPVLSARHDRLRPA